MALCLQPRISPYSLDGKEHTITLVMGMAGPGQTWRQWLGQSTWASPGDWLTWSAASWEEVSHCFGGCVGPLWDSAQCRDQWVPVPSTNNRGTCLCFNDPTVDPPETDLLMSGDRAGAAPREASRASSPGGMEGVWSETGRAGKQRPGFCLGKPQGELMLFHPICLLLWGHEKAGWGGGLQGWDWEA